MQPAVRLSHAVSASDYYADRVVLELSLWMACAIHRGRCLLKPELYLGNL